MKSQETRDRERREAQEALAQLKTEFVKLLTSIAEGIEAFLDRHPWLMPDNRFTKFLERVVEIEARIWRWFFNG